MHSVSILFILLFGSSSCALPLGLRKLIGAWNDVKRDLPIVHLDTPEPGAAAGYVPDGFGFSFEDEWRGDKRSPNDKHNDLLFDAPHIDDPFGHIDPTSTAPAGLLFDDSPPRKRGLFGDIDLDLSRAHDPGTSQTPGVPKGWIFEDATKIKREETLTQIIHGIVQPSEAADVPTPDSSKSRP